MAKKSIYIILAVLLLICSVSVSPVGSAKKQSALSITESIHLTKEHGVISIGQLIRQQSSIEIPNQPISGFHFLVDPYGGALLFPGNEFQPQGFQWAVLPGQDKKFSVPELPINGPDALEFSLVKTDGVCNFILAVEFYPRSR
jgi:hypothetical protein